MVLVGGNGATNIYTHIGERRKANSLPLLCVARRNKGMEGKRKEKPQEMSSFFIKYPAHHRPRKLVGAKRNKLDTALLVLVN